MLEYIDAAIGRREPLPKVLKLLSLFCLADDGFASKAFDQYRRDIIQVRVRKGVSPSLSACPCHVSVILRLPRHGCRTGR